MLPVLRIAKSYLVVTFMLTCAVHAQHRKPKTYHDHSHEPLCNAHQELHNKKSNQYKNPKQSVPISSVLENLQRDDSSCNWDTPNYQSFANLSPEEVVNEVKAFTRDCAARWLYEYSTNHSPAIFSDENLQAVIQSVAENAETYDGTYSSGMYGYLYYLHAALFHDWYEDDFNISPEVISNLVMPIKLLSENPNLYEFSEPALETLFELTIVIDVRTVRHTQGAITIIKDILKKIVIEENWKDVPEDLYFEYGSAYNNIHWNISRGVGNQDTLYHQVLSTDSEFFDLMGQLGVYKELKEFERFSYLVENVPWTLSSPAAVDLLNELSINQIEKIYNAKLYERLEIEWIDLVLAILDNGDCSTINICDESTEKIKEDLNDMLFPNKFSFDDGKMVVKTSLPIEKVQTLYYAAKQVQASFFRLLQNDNPLPEDTNDVLNMVVYGSPEEYDEYQYFLNGLSTNNGGIYIEEDATFYTYDRTPEQSIYSLEELFRHEYVHYLQGRFLINGLFGKTPFYKNGRLTWFNEGMAEFIAGSTSRDGIKIRETILDRIERDGADRLEINEIIGSTYNDGFKFYRYGSLLWSHWYDYNRDFYKYIFDLVISEDLEGYDLLLESLKSEESLQNAYNQYIDQSIAKDNTWQPNTEWLADSDLIADSHEELKIESTDEVTINSIGPGETEMNKRFLITGTLELLEPNEEDNIIDQFEAKLNEFLKINTQSESVNNLQDAVAYFEDIDTENKIAQFKMTGPLRKGAMIPPIAGFTAAENVISINSSIKYLDKTENTGIDFSWEFEGGEPSTSTAKNPVVTYSEPGLYNVKLTATNDAGTSEIIKSSYVMVLNTELDGYCTTNNTSSENYISSVQFGYIQNRSEWENYTQTNWFTSLLPSDTIPLKVSTPWLERGTDHTVGVWIDWNQNSVFGDEDEEIIINEASIEEPLNMQVVVPDSVKGGLTKMRVRINYWNGPSRPCGDARIGEVEDYYIFVGTGEEKPIADFKFNQNLIFNAGTVDLIDQSDYFPSAWSWTFEEADLTTSDEQNPSVAFDKLGLHEITLEVENENGISETKQSKHILVTDQIETDHCPVSHSDGNNYISWVQFGDINVNSEWDDYSLNDSYFALMDTSETLELNVSTLRLDQGGEQTIGVWIDWNQNSIFGDEDEETIINATSIDEPLNMQVTVPATAKSGLTKMRVRINNRDQLTHPCGDDTTGEVEDYLIFVGTGEENPIADFNFNQNLILNEGTVDFSDRSQHFPGAWTWTFEDGSPSNSDERNPSASFEKLGLHEVTLEVENKNGISETKQSKHVLVTDQIETDHCPASHSDGDNYITRVQFGDIDVTSEWDGYSLNNDYFALVDTSSTHELYVSTHWLEKGFEHTLGVWIDWNQNSIFGDEDEETIINVASIEEPLDIQLTVPATAKSGLTTMRVRINNWSQPSRPCGDDTTGEVEDYVIFVGTGKEKPIADFSFNQNLILNEGTVDFNDQSKHFPDAWTWTFEDASPSTSDERNPSVSFEKLGLHEVTLEAENKNGISETKQSKHILVTDQIDTEHCQVNHSNGDNYIKSVQFVDIDVTSEWDGYSLNDDYFALVDTSETHQLNVSTVWLEEGITHALAVWIDWNQNSIFGDEDEETIINEASIEEALSMQVKVPATAKSGLTKMRVRINDWSEQCQPCGDGGTGEVEDYVIFVGTGEEKPIADFSFNQNLILNEGTVDFNDQSKHFPDAWTWTFEDASPSTSNEQNPLVSFEKLGLHEVTLEAENKNGISETKQSKHILVTDQIDTEHCQVNHSNGDNYIKSVQFVDIDVTSEWDGYSLNDDYFALVDTSETHQLNVSTAWLEEGIAHTLGVWVDWNQNSVFGDEDEETIINVASIEEPLDIQLTVPATAKSGLTKMRVRINSWDQPSQPCGDDGIGEVEDYVIFVGTGKEKPIADFNFNQNLILDEGTIDFSDQSKHFPDAWTWTFEDASPSTSDERNPSVSFDKLGIHEVTLEVENKNGTSETKQSKHVLVTDQIETDHCPASHSDGDNYITKVQFGDINVTSEWDGYSLNDDYFALVDTSETHQLNVSTAWLEEGSAHTLGVWVDWNQNSIFGDEDEETIINVASIEEPLNMQVVVPSTAKSGLTKMRVRINNWDQPSSPCGDDGSGEVEDYFIFVGTGEEKPIADFNFNRNLVIEEGTVDFNDESKHFPIAWTWTFEDASPSTSDERNPLVSFEKLGLHEVTLEVENKNGISETKQSKHILVTGQIDTEHCQVNHSNGDNYIKSVQFADIDVTSEWDGYSLNDDYFALVDTSETHQLNVSTAWLEEGIAHTLGVWVDWNQNSVFGDEDEETIINVASIEEPLDIQLTVPATAKSGLTKMRVRINIWDQPSQPCGDDGIGEVEDYIIFVGTGKEKPIADFNFNQNLILDEGTIDFSDQSKHFPDAWKWTFEDASPSTSDERNPSVSFDKPGIHEVTLEVENKNGTSETKQSKHVLVTDQIETDHCPASHSDGDNYITKVQFGDINVTSEWDGYSLNDDYFALVDTSETHQLNVSTAWLEEGSAHTLGVWVDWNQNSNFGDEDEETIINVASIEDPLNMQFTVPATAKSGLTKMRVRINNWDEPSRPCGDDTMGEVEDYIIFVGTGEEKPIADFNFNRNLIVEEGTVDFTDESKHFPTAWSWTFEDANLSTSNEQNPSVSFDKLGLHEVTLEVENENGFSETKQSKHILVTEENETEHCQVSHTNGDNYITRVQFGDIKMTSEWEGYSLNDDFFALVDTSEIYELNINTFSSEQGSDHTLGVWIDWNEDGDFDDLEETVFNDSEVMGPYFIDVSIPSDVTTGLKVMRVRIDNWSDLSMSCGQGTIGEVEDYLLWVRGTDKQDDEDDDQIITSTSINDEIKIFPNPGNGKITLTPNAATESFSVVLYNTTGKIVDYQIIRHTRKSYQLDYSYLSTGVYHIKIINQGTVFKKKLIISR